jgi:carbon-monoxide dehydrogenase medium subunit
MLRPFRLEEPESVKEASESLARYGDSAKIYAGGTELLLAMKEGLIHFECLVNVKKIPGLDQITQDNGSLRLGALSTHRQLERSETLQEKLPVLVEMERNVANLRVREVGTIGGNLTFAEPHADPGTLLLALDATVVAQKAGGSRDIPMTGFFVDAYEAAVEEDEVLTEIVVPLPDANAAVRYRKFGYLERPSAGVALHVMADETRKSVKDVRIAVGCVGPKSMRVEEAEAVVRGKSLDEAAQLMTEAGDIAGRAADAISDLHGSAEYKEHIVKVLLTRAFNDIRAELAG